MPDETTRTPAEPGNESSGEAAEERARLEAVFDHLPVGLCIGDAAGGVIYLNRAGLAVHGFSSLDEMLRGWEDYTRRYEMRTAEDAVVAVADWPTPRALRGEFVRDFEVRLCDRVSGAERVVSYTTTPVRDGRGEVGLIIYVVQDLTERTAVERALRASGTQFRLLAETMPQLVWTADSAGVVDYYNGRAAHYGGLERSERGDWEWRPLVHPEDVPRTAAAWQAAVEQGDGYEIEHRAQMADGSYRWHLSRALPLRDERGRVVRWFGTATDIHALREAQRELEAARDRAVAANRAKDDFLAALSHELRTPLNPVLLTASARATDESLPEAVRADFAMIARHVAWEARLIDDLLDLNRIALGKVTVERRPVAVHMIVRDAVATLREEIAAKGLRLTLTLAAPEDAVEGDAVRLRQVFWNVLKNAVKFTPAGGEITVESSPTGRGEAVEVRVRDTGAGMTPAELARAFDPFAQGDGAPAESAPGPGGLGLGLAIARGLVERHGGWIEASSGGRGAGAEITIVLPLGSARGAAAGAAGGGLAGAGPNEDDGAAGAARSEGASGEGARRQLLLLEDHAATREALALLLRRRGWRVQAAASVAEARRLAAEAEGYDALIADLGLPDGDGAEMMIELRRRWPELPGIAISGYGMESDRERARAAGFAEHLTKPVAIDTVERALGRLVGACGRAG